MLLVIILVVVLLGSWLVSAGVTRRGGGTVPARVHVDDLAVGRFPDVCAVTGVPTANRVPVESSRGGFQPWWLLLLVFGPLGIVAIVVLAVLGSRVERVGGLLPVSDQAIDAYNRSLRAARRASWAMGGAVVGGFGLLVLARAGSPLLGALVLGTVVVCLIAHVVLSMLASARWLDLRIDASGRWVTVDRAHAGFAQAVRSEQHREARSDLR